MKWCRRSWLVAGGGGVGGGMEDVKPWLINGALSHVHQKSNMYGVDIRYAGYCSDKMVLIALDWLLIAIYRPATEYVSLVGGLYQCINDAQSWRKVDL